MFDTVFFKEYRTINAKIVGDWTFTREEVMNNGETTAFKAHARHDTLNLKAYSHDGETFGVYHVPSLPELIYGYKSRVIESQSDLDLALTVVDLLLDQIGTPIPGNKREYHRADVAAQLRMNYRSVHTAYAHSKQSHAQKVPQIYPGESITLPLSGQNLRFYNKGKQIGSEKRQGLKMKVPQRVPLENWLDSESAEFLRANGYRDPEPDVVRVEVQFEHPKIAAYLGDGNGKPTHLDIDRAYQALRKVLLAIKVETFPSDSRKLSTFLALVNYKNPELYEKYLDHYVGERRRKELMREVSRYMPKMFGEELDWATILPADRRPPFEAIDLPGEENVPYDSEEGFVAQPDNYKKHHPPYPELVREARKILKMK